MTGRMGSEFGKKAQQSGEELVLDNDEVARRIGSDVLSVYKQDIRRMKLGETVTPYSDRIAVSKGIESALLDSKPYPRYFCGKIKKKKFILPFCEFGINHCKCCLGVDVNTLLPFALHWPEGLVDLVFEAAYRWFRSPGKPVDLNPATMTTPLLNKPIS
jgi:hypothetical protein